MTKNSRATEVGHSIRPTEVTTSDANLSLVDLLLLTESVQESISSRDMPIRSSTIVAAQKLVDLGLFEIDITHKLYGSVYGRPTEGGKNLIKKLLSLVNSHPWDTFLDARLEAIHWMKSDGKTDEEIASNLSMDPGQVAAILKACGVRVSTA